jgi:FlaG/FlaF family flagellin (archaellin)
MISKRGLSDVVTTVLIVLLTIVAIAILWSFLQPLFTSSGQKVQTQQQCLALSLEINSCTTNISTTKNITFVNVKRNPGEAPLKEVKLIFEKADGTTKVIQKTFASFNELETQQYLADTVADLGYLAGPNKPTEVSVSGGIDDGKGKVVYCNPTQPIVCG